MLVRRLAESHELVAGDGSRLRELLHPARDPAAIHYSLAVARLAPGDRSRPHRLKATEVYYFLCGRGTMYVGDDRAQVSAGDAVYVPPGAVQWLENAGVDPIVFACIVDPAWRSEDEELL